MITILYTDSDRVLSTLGLTPEDLDDAFFQVRDLEKILSVDLFTWLPTHSSIFVPFGTSLVTEKDQFNSDCLTLYCMYFCAHKVLDGIIGLMSRETDGQNEYARFSSIDFKTLGTSIQQQAGYYRQTLLKSLAADNVAVRVAQSTVVVPTYDPVTG